MLRLCRVCPVVMKVKREREIGSPAVALLKSLMTVELRSEHFKIKVNV